MSKRKNTFGSEEEGSNHSDNNDLDDNGIEKEIEKPIKNDYLELIQNEYNYTNSTTEGSKLLMSHDYEEALKHFKDAFKYADKIDDPFRKHEASINLGICQYLNGSIANCLNTLMQPYSELEKQILGEQITTKFREKEIIVKLCSNLSICNLTLNQTKESFEIANTLMDFINREVNIYTKKILMKIANLVFFKTESIVQNDEVLIAPDPQEQIAHSIIVGFNEYLRNKNAQEWMDKLSEIKDKMNQIKDYNGVVFALFNLFCTLYVKEVSNEDKKEMISKSTNTTNIQLTENALMAKKKLCVIIQTLNELEINDSNPKKNFNNQDAENSVNKILKSFKDKLECAFKIFDLCHETEVNISKANSSYNAEFLPSYSQISMNKGNKSRIIQKPVILLKLLLRYSIYYLNLYIPDNDLRVNIIKQLETTLDLVENEQAYDINELDLNSFSPEISKYVFTLIANLRYIYERSLKKRKFDQFRTILSKTKTKAKDKILKNYFDKCFNEIYNGENLLKVNLTSSGTKLHYYQLDNEKDQLECYESNSMKPKAIKVFKFDDMVKIVIGVRTKNLASKLDKLKNRETPWLFMSIIFPDSSLDFSFSDIFQAKRWFYGFKRYLSRSQRDYKMLSNSGYLMQILKLEMKQDLGIEKTKMSFVKTLLEYNKSYTKL